MHNSKRITAVVLSFLLAFCSGGFAFADDVQEPDPALPEAAETTEQAEAIEEPEQAEPAEEPEVIEEEPEAVEEEVPEAAAPEELPEETDSNATDEAAEEPAGGIEIIQASSPVEASQAVPAADNDAFYSVDLNNGKVTDQSDNNVANGFAEIYGEKYSETGLKGMSDSQREEHITDMTTETELYSIAGTDGDTAEVVSTFSTCRLIVDAQAAGSEIETFGAAAGTEYEGLIVLSYENEEATAKAYQSLCERYGKANVLIDLPGKLCSTGKATSYWNTKVMGFRNVAPDIKKYGDNVTVAVLDSGINRYHALIKDGRKIYKGYDFANNDSNPADDFGHGTAVTSIITQSTESNVKILPVKIGDSSGGINLLNVLLGVDYARTHGADIVNLSIGVYLLPLSRYDEDTVKKFIAKADTFFKKFKGPIIAAAGNESLNINDYLVWPAVSKYTIAVSALTEGTGSNPVFDSSYSNYGAGIDFSAPGTKINIADYKSTTGSVTYESDGTSYAAPHVTAAAALLMANKSSISTKVQVKTALGLISKDLGPAGKDVQYGRGCPMFTGSNLAISKNVRNIKKATVKIANKTYTGKALMPGPVIKYGRATLVKNKNYTLKYYNNKNVGKAKIVIAGKGLRHTGKKTVYFKINPKGTKLTKYKPAKKAMTVYWKKQSKKMSKSRITGYQIQIATNAKFTKNKKTKKVKGYKKTKVKFKKLKRNKRYYARIRTYKKTKTGTYYSPWSVIVYGYSH